MNTKEPLRPSTPDSIALKILRNRLLLVAVDGARLIPLLNLYEAMIAGLEQDYQQEYRSICFALLFALFNRLNRNWNLVEERCKAELNWLKRLRGKD